MHCSKLKEELKRVTIKSIQNFTHVHPHVFEKIYTESLAKRIAGQTYSYLLSKGLQGITLAEFMEGLDGLEETEYNEDEDDSILERR